MRTNQERPMPQIRFRNDQEQALYDSYVEEWLEEYPDLTPPQVRQLHKAGLNYILGLRLAEQALQTNLHTGLNSRYSYQMEEARILTNLGLDRKDTIKGTPTSSNEESELREALLKLSPDYVPNSYRATSKRKEAN